MDVKCQCTLNEKLLNEWKQNKQKYEGTMKANFVAGDDFFENLDLQP